MFREAWRAARFCEWRDGDRHETVHCKQVAYDPRRYKAMLAMRQTVKGATKIFYGAVVSPACYARGGASRTCPLCNATFGSYHHLVWECPAQDFRRRPRRAPCR